MAGKDRTGRHYYFWLTFVRIYPVAGKRDGLDGKRSSLFYEAIRIAKRNEVCYRWQKTKRYRLGGKTSLEPSHQTKEKISDVSLKASATSRIEKPL